MSDPAVPISQVQQDGRVRRIGQWLPAERRLELSQAGYPLLGPGSHEIDGDLPWVFWDMCPSGFLGRRFARVEASLSLNADPRTWSVGEAMRALTLAGEELPGNLIIGEQSLHRWQRHRDREDEWEAQARAFYRGEIDEAPGLSRVGGVMTVGRRPWDPPTEIDEWLNSEQSEAAPSSLGGERPKLSRVTRDGGQLWKFSPPLGTPQAQRWADLLRVEAHCSDTLRHGGVGAVTSSALSVTTGAGYRVLHRVLLQVARFDRLADWGRRGAVTFYWYAMARYGDVRTPAPEVVRDLVADGHLQAAAFETLTRVHAFSAAIGNNDTHLGNYGLVFDDEGRAELAPLYDILPMVLAPSNDELPDSRLRPRSGALTDPVVATWVSELVRRVEADQKISRAFVELWRRHIGS